MSKPKPRAQTLPDHSKKVELHKSREVWGHFVSEHAHDIKEAAGKAANEEHNRLIAEQKAEGKRLIRAHTDQDRKDWLLENKPTKYDKILRNLEKMKALTEEIGDPGVHYEGDVRVAMVVPDKPGLRHRLKNALSASDEEVDILLQNLEEFPGLRFMYYPWLNESKLIWDHD